MHDSRIQGQGQDGIRHDELIDGVRLLTPTRPQWTRDELETDLLIQIAFSRRVSDAATQPILDVGGVRYVPSLLFHLFADLEGRPLTHVIEVDAGDGRLDAKAINAGRAWCRRHDAAFHVLDATTIRTAHLANARLMTRYIGLWPVDEDVNVLISAES